MGKWNESESAVVPLLFSSAFQNYTVNNPESRDPAML